MRAYADFDGNWVTKDVYPLAIPRHGASHLGRLVAILNSTVFTCIYNTVYHGIIIGGEYYHYLPAFLEGIPVPDPDRLPRDVESTVKEIQRSLHRRRTRDALVAEMTASLDGRVAALYGISPAELELLRSVHLTRLRSPVPWEPTRRVSSSRRTGLPTHSPTS